MSVGFMVEKPREKGQLERHRYVCVSGINTDPKENELAVVDWVLVSR